MEAVWSPQVIYVVECSGRCLIVRTDKLAIVSELSSINGEIPFVLIKPWNLVSIAVHEHVTSEY